MKNHKHKYKYKTTKGNTITKQLGSDPRSLPHPKALYAHNAADWAFWPSCKQIRNYSLIHLISHHFFWSCNMTCLKNYQFIFYHSFYKSLLLCWWILLGLKLWAICHFYLIYPLIQIRNTYSIDFILDIPIMQRILLIRDVDWNMAWVETKCWLLEPFVLCWRFLLGIWRIFPPSLPRWQMFV